QYALLLEELRAQHQLRLAAADRRLEAHQEAFTLWAKLVSHTHQDSISAVVAECQEWWLKNCVYLSLEAREAFSEAYFAAHMHSGLLQDRSNPRAVAENWEAITSAGT